MKIRKKVLEEILDVVYGSAFGVTVEDIVKRTKHHRVTVSRYLVLLEDMGLIFLRRIGNYLIAYPIGVAEALRNDAPGLLLASILKILVSKGLSREELVDLGRRVSSIIVSNFGDVVKEHLRRIARYFPKIINIYFPAITPNFRVKIEKADINEDMMIISFSGIRSVESRELQCFFYMGYLEGILRGLGFPLRKVELLETKICGDMLSCRYIVLLEKSLGEVMKEVL